MQENRIIVWSYNNNRMVINVWSNIIAYSDAQICLRMKNMLNILIITRQLCRLEILYISEYNFIGGSLESP